MSRAIPSLILICLISMSAGNFLGFNQALEYLAQQPQPSDPNACTPEDQLSLLTLQSEPEICHGRNGFDYLWVKLEFSGVIADADYIIIEVILLDSSLWQTQDKPSEEDNDWVYFTLTDHQYPGRVRALGYYEFAADELAWAYSEIVCLTIPAKEEDYVPTPKSNSA